MCNEKLTRSKAKKDLNKSREDLKKSVERGNETLCQMIARILHSHVSNIVSSDGNNNK